MAETEGRRVTTFTLTIAVLRLGDGYLATANLAGVNFRGNRKRTAVEAARDIFAQMLGDANLDANLALDLAAAGEDYGVISAQLPAAIEHARRAGVDLDKEGPSNGA